MGVRKDDCAIHTYTYRHTHSRHSIVHSMQSEARKVNIKYLNSHSKFDFVRVFNFRKDLCACVSSLDLTYSLVRIIWIPLFMAFSFFAFFLKLYLCYSVKFTLNAHNHTLTNKRK